MRIGLIGHNSIEYIELLLSIWENGDSAVLIDYATPSAATSELLLEAKAAKCFVEESLPIAKTVGMKIKTETYAKTYKMPCLLPKTVREMYKPNYDEAEAVVIYSSGTTGKAKGVSLSHRAINNNADSIIDYMHPERSDCLYLNKKLSHCSSLIGELLVALKSGANILVSEIVIPPRVAFRNIQNYSVSILCCNPTLLKLYVTEAEISKNFSVSVRKIYTSGDIISAKDMERARTILGCPVYNVYGQSECGPRIAAQTADFCSGNSVGKAIKNVEIKVDKNGEILVKTNAIFTGYIGTDTKKSEWHKTGDIGFFDDNGELHVTGRTDNMIVIGAHNISPEEIEKKIAENTAIEDCIVFKCEEKLVCKYVSNPEIEAIQVIKTLKPLLMPYEVPREYRRAEKISYNRNGKKIRKANKEDVEQI